MTALDSPEMDIDQSRHRILMWSGITATWARTIPPLALSSSGASSTLVSQSSGTEPPRRWDKGVLHLASDVSHRPNKLAEERHDRYRSQEAETSETSVKGCFASSDQDSGRYRLEVVKSSLGPGASDSFLKFPALDTTTYSSDTSSSRERRLVSSIASHSVHGHVCAHSEPPSLMSA